jgi:hypothetical protein
MICQVCGQYGARCTCSQDLLGFLSDFSRPKVAAAAPQTASQVPAAPEGESEYYAYEDEAEPEVLAPPPVLPHLHARDEPPADWVPPVYVPPAPAVQDPEPDSRWAGSGGHRRRNVLIAAGCAAVVAVGAAAGLLGTGHHARPLPALSAKPLGRGVTVLAPGPTAASTGTPGAVALDMIKAGNSNNEGRVCQDVEPAAQAGCQSAAARIVNSSTVRYSHFALGYTAISGSRALVVVTGKACSSPGGSTCRSNSDPAAALSSGSSFSALFARASRAGASGGPYSLVPCVRVGGHWYVYSAPNDF